MRRVIFILLTIFSILTAEAQHLNFMGVELGNKVSKFNKELISKGYICKLSPDIGDIFVNGTFAGYKADVMLYRQQPTKKVRSAVATIIDEYDSFRAVEILNDIKGKILNKYPGATVSDISDGGPLPHISIAIHNQYDEHINLLIDEKGKVNVAYIGDLTKRDPNDDI